ncbi:MspA family porin [Mycolicibacterium sp. S2-37]|uniref:MspA family porin n=1 Tax=Mycolicibacterium sp. S2-37 TaxID=2810297 RepID=UPI001A954350|nr:MspA family porin [Mycolicibacterium sp. S2-37]MBO0680502.1 MspA family porin [Mycolicibacterium sp. S2-37]
MSVGAGVAAAEPLPVADATRSAGTDDGWQLSASLTGMRINSVPNMAATAFTREGFVSGSATATIDGDGRVPVNSGTLVLGVQLGCQIDLSEGANLGISNESDIVTSSPFEDLSPFVSVTLQPGSITSLSLGRKSIKGRTGKIAVHDAHVHVDACGGPVSVRLFASAAIYTDNSDDSVNTYGAIVQL